MDKNTDADAESRITDGAPRLPWRSPTLQKLKAVDAMAGGNVSPGPDLYSYS